MTKNKNSYSSTFTMNYTIEYALSPVLVSGAFLFSVTFEILHLYTTAAMYVVYTTDSIYTVACTVEIELHKRSHISFFGQLDLHF